MSKTASERSLDHVCAVALLLLGSVVGFAVMASDIAAEAAPDQVVTGCGADGAAGFWVKDAESSLSLVPCDVETGDEFACPPWSQVSQIPPMPPFFDAATSDTAAEFLVFEDFDVDTEICGIHFWGFTVPSGGAPVECTEDPMTFTVTFYQDAGGVPGAEVWSDTLVLQRTPTGVFYAIFENTLELLEYSAELFPCYASQTGWVSVEGSSVAPDGDCWFMWISSVVGNGQAWQQYPSGSLYGIWDRSLCLVGAPMGACCVQASPYCTVETEAYCDAVGGTYLGDATECDTNDCNSNGIPDSCDIAVGFSDDDDGDGLPDECEGEVLLVSGTDFYPPGNPVVISIGLSDAESVIVGGQFFLEYDT